MFQIETNITHLCFILYQRLSIFGFRPVPWTPKSKPCLNPKPNKMKSLFKCNLKMSNLKMIAQGLCRRLGHHGSKFEKTGPSWFIKRDPTSATKWVGMYPGGRRERFWWHWPYTVVFYSHVQDCAVVESMHDYIGDYIPCLDGLWSVA